MDTFLKRALLALCVVLLIRQGGAQYTCYECTGDGTATTCITPTSSTPTSTGCVSCDSIVIVKSGSITSIQRHCVTNSSAPTPSACVVNSDGSKTCTSDCTANLCNTDTAGAGTGSLTCYVCSDLSSTCTSPVQGTTASSTGCATCGRSSTSVSGVLTTLSRTCLPVASSTTTNACATTGNTLACTAFCQTSYCNSASDDAPHFFLVLVLLLACLAGMGPSC